ncbi:sugar ABC transporter substrate-binding protein [Vallitalea longa]|uniref:Sugar ABC transporter substrate-binding protein n=1 Tax=Vallitalea longa TaxID=2936439 RepID=A0A9W5YAG3_9FIRM|nr:sugar ABC transporter substrate-binding protein [Vallitalea longa]GKX29877.1 sugar ABC transporter substrate-binding protein [Vallitalea longa]
MKETFKKTIMMLLILVLGVTMTVGCSKKEEKKDEEVIAQKEDDTQKNEDNEEDSGMVVGMTVQDLSNQIWSSSCEALKGLVEADGGKMTYLDCANNASKQIEQIENFIANDVDAIVVHPVDVNAVEQVLSEAREAGIKVYSWDENLENADIVWLIDNYELGKIIGQEAARWINDVHNGECEVAVLDYPQIPVLLERGNGIVDAIKEYAPKAKIVAKTSAINPTEGMAKMETIFQANPEVQVVCCIGGGGAVGANEAIKAAGKLTDKIGVFAADATEQEMEAIKNNEANRMSVLITGNGEAIANEIYGWLEKLVAGEDVEKEVYRNTIIVTAENVDDYCK